jgi:hypothetical protein
MYHMRMVKLYENMRINNSHWIQMKD